MNTRFKFLLINYLSRYRASRNSGFALPMAIMVGASIIVVGLAVVIQAQGNKSKVVSQVMTAQADSLAEAGATQYIDFLNTHPVLLTSADQTQWATQWTSYLAGDIDGTGQPANGSGTPQSGATCENTNLDSAGNTIDNGAGLSTTTASEITNSWVNPANGRTVGNGKVELAGYAYTADGTAGTSPGTAVLAIKGTVGEAGNNQATSQIQYTFRVGTRTSTPPSPSPNTPIIPQTNPGLWARNFLGTSGKTYYSNVLDSSGCTSGNTSFAANMGALPIVPLPEQLPNGNQTPPLSGITATKVKADIPFPPLPTYPTDWSSDPKHLERDPAATADA